MVKTRSMKIASRSCFIKRKNNLMKKIRALIDILIGLLLMAAGVVVEVMWLSFCFGTIIIGLVLLLRFTPLLFAPFIFMTVGGWRLMKSGINRLYSIRVDKVSEQIAPIVSSQIRLIEQEIGQCPIDATTTAYFTAHALVRSGNVSMSVDDALEIMSGFFSSPKYDLALRDLPFLMRRQNLHVDGYKGFWSLVSGLMSIAREEVDSEAGVFLIKYVLGEDSVPPF
jgi:hypothetical protein